MTPPPYTLNPKAFFQTSPYMRYRWGMGLLFCMFPLAVLMPYYVSKGLSPAQFFYIEALYRVAYFLFNGLTGYISDRWSRKGCLIIGACCWWLGAFTIFLGHGFWGVALGEVIFALGMAFYVSSGRAWLYDMLLSENRSHDHPRQLSLQRSIEHGLRAFAMAAGGFMFVAWSELPQVAVLFTTALSIAVFTTLPEPRMHEAKAQDGFGWKSYMEVARAVTARPGLPELMVFGAFLVGSTTLVFWGIQPAMRQAEMSVPLFSILFALVGFATSFFSHFSHRIIEKIGIKKLALILLLIALGCMAVLSLVHHPIAMLALVLNAFVFVTATNAFEDLIHRQIPSSMRAGTHSFYVMLEMLASAPILFLTGLLMEWTNLSVALALMTALFGGMGFLLLRRLFRVLPALAPETPAKP
jgi:MFS family permease